jgi:hypothetical protein
MHFEHEMSSYESDAIYRLLLKRYEEKGFLSPRAALDTQVKYVMQKGRTWEEAVRELYSSDSPWTYSPPEKPTVSKQEKEETEQEKAVFGQILLLVIW